MDEIMVKLQKLEEHHTKIFEEFTCLKIAHSKALHEIAKLNCKISIMSVLTGLFACGLIIGTVVAALVRL